MKLQPVDASFLETAPRRFETSGIVHAAPAAVWEEIISDRWSSWFPNMSVCTYSSAPPYGLGSERTVKIGGLRVDERIVQFEPTTAWAFCGLDANIPIARRLIEGFALDAIDGGASTRLTYRAGLEPTLLSRPVAKLLERQMTSSWASAISALDRLLSAR